MLSGNFVSFYKGRKQRINGYFTWLAFYLYCLSLCGKVSPAIHGPHLLGFREFLLNPFVQLVIVELRDGVIKGFNDLAILRFLLLCQLSSGPIDRFKRFNENYETIPERDESMDMLEEAVSILRWASFTSLSWLMFWERYYCLR